MSTRSKFVLLAVAGVLAGAVGLRCAQTSWPISTAQAAVGDVTALGSGEARAVELLASATAVNSPPSGASAGLALDKIALFNILPDEAVLTIASTAGSGTMTATFRLWGRLPVAGGVWFPLGPGGDSTKGLINQGAAVGETSADAIRHSEVIENLGLFDRLYLEVTAIGGTATAVTAWLVVRRPR